VISGNVSLYNETNGEAIWPTPVVGMVGLIEDVDQVVPMGFQGAGDAVFVVHAGLVNDPALAGTQVVAAQTGIVAGQPRIDLQGEVRLQRFLADASARGLLRSAHDVSAGGIGVAVAECCMAGRNGLMGSQRDSTAFGLFGEPQSAIIVSARPEHRTSLREAAVTCGLTCTKLGQIGHLLDSRLVFAGVGVKVLDLTATYESGLARALDGVTANM